MQCSVSVAGLNIGTDPSLQRRDHGMDTQDLEFKFVAKRVEKVM